MFPLLPPDAEPGWDVVESPHKVENNPTPPPFLFQSSSQTELTLAQAELYIKNVCAWITLSVIKQAMLSQIIEPSVLPDRYYSHLNREGLLGMLQGMFMHLLLKIAKWSEGKGKCASQLL